MQTLQRATSCPKRNAQFRTLEKRCNWGIAEPLASPFHFALWLKGADARDIKKNNGREFASSKSRGLTLSVVSAHLGDADTTWWKSPQENRRARNLVSSSPRVSQKNVGRSSWGTDVAKLHSWASFKKGKYYSYRERKCTWLRFWYCKDKLHSEYPIIFTQN